MEDPLGYYAVLNVSPSASEREIRDSFNRLSRALHPDKQPDLMKAAAAGTFVRLEKAKEVLLDPSKRFAYDQYGEVGVSLLENRSRDFTLQKTDVESTERLNSKIRKLIKETNERELRGHLNPRTDINISLTCADSLDAGGPLKVQWNSTRLQEFIKCELGKNLAFDLGFVVYSKGRMGLAALSPRLYWNIGSSATAQVGLQIGDIKGASIALQKRINQST